MIRSDVSSIGRESGYFGSVKRGLPASRAALSIFVHNGMFGKRLFPFSRIASK